MLKSRTSWISLQPVYNMSIVMHVLLKYIDEQGQLARSSTTKCH